MAKEFRMSKELITNCSVCDEVNRPEAIDVNTFGVNEEDIEASQKARDEWKGVIGYRVGEYWGNCVCVSCMEKTVKAYELMTKNKLKGITFDN